MPGLLPFTFSLSLEPPREARAVMSDHLLDSSPPCPLSNRGVNLLECSDRCNHRCMKSSAKLNRKTLLGRLERRLSAARSCEFIVRLAPSNPKGHQQPKDFE